MRNIFNFERTTHRYLIELLSGCLHPKIMLASMFTSFHKSLVNCSKFCVRYLATLARLLYLMQQCTVNQLEDLSPVLIKKSLKYSATPEAVDWRIPLALELKDIRDGKSTLSDFSKSEVEELLAFVCTS
jgi:hypothetical protein